MNRSLGLILVMAYAMGCQIEEMTEEAVGRDNKKSCNKCERFSHDDECLFCHGDKKDYLLGLYDEKEDFKVKVPLWCPLEVENERN